MPCDHKLIEEYLINYVDGKLEPSLIKEIDKIIGHCKICRESYHQVLELQQLSSQWHDEPVPEWHRTNFVVRPMDIQHNWLNWSSIALSLTAIILIIFHINSNTTDGRLEPVLNLGIYEQEINLLIDSRLKAYQLAENNLSFERDVIRYAGQLENEGLIQDKTKSIFAQRDSEYLPLVKVQPRYPTEALKNGIEGYVIVQFEVRTDGTTKNIVVVESSPEGVFDEAAMDAAEEFQYQPRIVDGEPVDVRGVQNKITFEIEPEDRPE